MRALGQPDASVDFAWSTSSLEHVPTLRDVTRVLDELARVLKDGGVGILSTEFCITQPPFHLPGVNAWDPDFFAAMKLAMDDVFEFVGAEDLAFNWVYPGNWMTPRQVRRSGVNQRLRNVLQPLFQAGPMQWPAGVSSLAPIAFVLRRQAAPRRLVRSPDGRRPLGPAATGTRHRRLHRRHRGDPGRAPSGGRTQLETVVRRAGLPLQFRLHAFRYYAEAGVLCGLDAKMLAGKRRCSAATCRAANSRTPTFLGYLGHIALSAGDDGEALRLLGLALRSPSTTLDHALSLLGDYLAAGKAGGQFRAAQGRGGDGHHRYRRLGRRPRSHRGPAFAPPRSPSGSARTPPAP